MIWRLSLSLALLGLSSASYCGQSAIPFTFQSLRSGHPVLGCARPRCFGWTANGTRAGDTAQFYRIAGKEDGYLRRSDQLLRSPNRNPNFVAQTSQCAEYYRNTSCVDGEWVGGIGPQTTPFTNGLQLRCCRYAPLLESEDRGMAAIKQGQVFIGGEVIEDDRLVAFDYISDVHKEIFDNGTITYSVSVRRFKCTDEGLDAIPEPVVSENAAVSKLDGDVQMNGVQQQASLPSTPRNVELNQQAAATTGPTPPAAVPAQALQSNILPVAAAPGAQQFPVQQAAAPGFQQQPSMALFQHNLMPLSLNGAGFPLMSLPGQQQAAAAPGSQPVAQQQQQQQFQQLPTMSHQQIAESLGLGHMIQQLPSSQVQQQLVPFSQVSSSAAPQQQTAQGQQGSAQQQQLNVVAPQQQQQQQQQQQFGLGQMSQLPTMAPIKLPRLEDLPKMEIPTIEDVENVIPPMQRAILTNIAKFFGVL